MRCGPGFLRLSFNKKNPASIAWARQQADVLIKGISDESRAAIRKVIGDSLEQGIPPVRAASLIRRSVGMTERDAGAMMKLRGMIVKNPGKTIAMGKFKVRVPAGGLSADQLDATLSRYANRAIHRRALSIARTATLRSSNEGQRFLWGQAVEKGLMSGKEERVWINTDDRKTCPICTGLDGKKAKLNGTFPGGYVSPPAHTGCRCATGLSY